MEYNVIQYHYDINNHITHYLNIKDIIHLNNIKQCYSIIRYRDEIIFNHIIDKLLEKFYENIQIITMWIHFHKPNFKKSKINYLKHCVDILNRSNYILLLRSDKYKNQSTFLNLSLEILLSKTKDSDVSIKHQLKSIFNDSFVLFNKSNRILFKKWLNEDSL